jgi:hypothetical protein
LSFHSPRPNNGTTPVSIRVEVLVSLMKLVLERYGEHGFPCCRGTFFRYDCGWVEETGREVQRSLHEGKVLHGVIHRPHGFTGQWHLGPNSGARDHNVVTQPQETQPMTVPIPIPDSEGVGVSFDEKMSIPRHDLPADPPRALLRPPLGRDPLMEARTPSSDGVETLAEKPSIDVSRPKESHDT